MALLASLLLVATAAARAAECERTTLCNGEMCASVCAPGTVALDAWVDASLRFQRDALSLLHDRGDSLGVRGLRLAL